MQRTQRFAARVLAAALGADGGEHAAAAGFHQIEHHVADADHLPTVLGPGGCAAHHQIGAELLQLDAAGATPLQIVERSLVNQQIRVAVGKGQRDFGVFFTRRVNSGPSQRS